MSKRVRVVGKPASVGKPYSEPKHSEEYNNDESSIKYRTRGRANVSTAG